MYHLQSFWHTSEILRGNPLADPITRQTWVLSPEGLDDQAPLPAIWMLASFMSTGAGFLAFRPWQETLADRINRLNQAGRLAPVRFILPDVFTRLGGSQYLDSPAIGAYQTYLFSELLAEVEARWATTKRGLAGTSSGGFGAIVTALTAPTIFSGVVAHAADMGFDWCYLPDFPKLFDALRPYGSVEAFWSAFQQTTPKPDSWIGAINLIAMAAAYSPNMHLAPPHTEFPLDSKTLAIIPAVWNRWLAWDPITLIDRPECVDRARTLDCFYFDAGQSDQYNLQYGAQRFHQKLNEYDIAHQFEIFSGGHFGTQGRFDHSLPILAQSLQD